MEPLYRELRRLEQAQAGPREGLEASAAALQVWLHDHGLTYDEFVRSVTP